MMTTLLISLIILQSICVVVFYYFSKHFKKESSRWNRTHEITVCECLSLLELKDYKKLEVFLRSELDRGNPI